MISNEMILSEMISTSEKQTKKIARQLVEKYQNLLKNKCLIFALEGELGAGKTIFAKGVAEALGIKKVIRSPSFIIQREFPYKLENVSGNFFHIDLWRMESGAEVEKLKIQELIKSGNVILIEWAEKMGEKKMIFKKKNIILVKIKIKFVDETTRNFRLDQ